MELILQTPSEKKAHLSDSFVESGTGKEMEILETAHFHESNGFYLKCDGEFPSSLEIKPTLEMGKVSVSIPRWKMQTSEITSKSKSYPSTWTKQAISLALMKPSKKVNEIMEDVIKFAHRQPLSSTSSSSSLLSTQHNKRISEIKTRLVDVYIPQKNELVGWIKYHQPTSKNLLENGWVLHDCVSNTVFLTLPHRLPSDLKVSSLDDAILAMQISTPEGLPVAILQAKRGMKQRKSGKVHWTDWKLHFSHNFSLNLPSSTKAIILVACIIWVLTYKEETAQKRVLANIRQSSLDMGY